MRNKARRRAWVLKNKDRINAYQRQYYKLHRHGWKGQEVYREGTSLWLGIKYEKIAASMLKGSKWLNREMWTKSPHDLLWKGKTVDVKMRHYTERKGWSFCLEGQRVDYYFLFCVKGVKLEKALLIPSKEINSWGINVGNKSKWDRFKF